MVEVLNAWQVALELGHLLVRLTYRVRLAKVSPFVWIGLETQQLSSIKWPQKSVGSGLFE